MACVCDVWKAFSSSKRAVLDCCVYLEQLLAVESGTIYKFAVVFEDPFPVGIEMTPICLAAGDS